MEASNKEMITFSDEIVKAQKEAAAKEWECFVDIFRRNDRKEELLFEPLDLVKNTAIHVLARSGNKQCLKELLQMLPKTKQLEALRKPNYEENTPLHEAVLFHDDPKMVDLIMGFMPSQRDKDALLEMKNNQNETVAFRAARYGRLSVIKYLHGKLQPRGLQSSKHFQPNIYGGRERPILHTLLPEDGYESELEDDAENNSVKIARDEESSQPNDGNKKTTKSNRFSFIGKIWDQKKRHKFAEQLVKLLLDIDEESWKQYPLVPFNEPIALSLEFPGNVTEKKEDMKLINRVEKEERVKKLLEDKKSKKKLYSDDKVGIMWKSTLFMAAASGIIEVVNLIVGKYPEAISYVNEDGLNILHVALKYRQLEIYEFIEKTSAFELLTQRISKDKRTILHQAGSMEYYREQGLAGVAYQLQCELEWYHRVREKIPKQYLMHADEDGLTAGDLLDIDHAEMHDEAKQWMKETAQSCSTVAVLIAGVVFAAAYAIPGGNEGGRPVLRTSSAFRIFTIMDVVALATSLGSVTVVRNMVGNTSSIGRSPTILDMKYEESMYIPEDRSFFSIVSSWGKRVAKVVGIEVAKDDGRTNSEVEEGGRDKSLTSRSRKMTTEPALKWRKEEETSHRHQGRERRRQNQL
ncbi:hypothetical protein JHK82_018448 [Glycine max]|nr:hypothetical protein JHK82_043423 [Glycine max]KAG5142753.1 hypothetical protein JHK82_018448 [Glycine max]